MFGQLSIHTLEDLMNVRQQELRREADGHRLAASVRQERNPIWPRAAWRLGSGLVLMGEWLKARQTRAICTD